VSPSIRADLLIEIFALAVRMNEIVRMFQAKEPENVFEGFIKQLSTRLDI
jgi:hypothetical protein